MRLSLRRLHTLSLTAALGAALGACGLDFPPVIWSGDHLDYATDRDDPLCTGTFVLQDRFIAALADHLGIRLRDRDRILYAFVHPEEIGEFCPNEGYGCAWGSNVASRRPFHRHELVHAVATIGGWDGPLPFKEGIAEVFGDGLGPGERLPVLEVLDNFSLHHDDYFTMALFVRFLLDRHGVPTFAGFMREAEHYDRPADYAASFRAHFGEDLEAAIAAFDDSYPTCSRWNNRIALLECADPAPWVDAQVTFQFELRCDSPEVQGPYGALEKTVGYRAFDVLEEGYHRILGTSDHSLVLQLSRCGSCVDAQAPDAWATNIEVYRLLTPGRYYLAFETNPAQEATIDVVIQRLD